MEENLLFLVRRNLLLIFNMLFVLIVTGMMEYHMFVGNVVVTVFTFILSRNYAISTGR